MTGPTCPPTFTCHLQFARSLHSQVAPTCCITVHCWEWGTAVAFSAQHPTVAIGLTERHVCVGRWPTDPTAHPTWLLL